MSADSITDSDYARRTRTLLDIIDRVRKVGGQLEVDLPSIAVIGNQSAGKSSLVEAIADITVPRGDQTCTRCPTEIRLRRLDKPWECNISVRFEFDDKVGKSRDRVQELSFGRPIFDQDRDAVEERLRRAQVAILNPTEAAKKLDYFLEFEVDDITTSEIAKPEVPFSKNVIVVEIVGPACTDLTFVDLPGIIQDDMDEAGSIETIRNLVNRYITKLNCLVLTAITMKDDMRNQAAIKMARDADPESRRTIRVLTKADVVEEGQHPWWFRVIRNEEYPMPHGYYVTKQPSLADRQQNITRHDARRKEAEFFDSAPWSQLPAEYKQRLGTLNLTAALSTLLINHIQATLPGIVKNVDERYQAVLKEFEVLPDAPSENPIKDVVDLCDRLCSDIAKHTRPDTGYEALVQANNQVFAQFKTDIWATRLDFTVDERDPKDTGRRTLKSLKQRQKLDLSDMHDFIELSRGRDLPLDRPPAAKNALINMSLTCWPGLSFGCFEKVKPTVINYLRDMVNQHFGRFEQGFLKTTVWSTVSNEIDRLDAATQRELVKLTELDDLLYTQNVHYLATGCEKFLLELKKRRRHQQKPTFVSDILSYSGVKHTREDFTNGILGRLAILGKTGLTAEDLTKLDPEDPFDREISLMAEVSAYFQVAYKRVIDDVPRIIDKNFVLPLSTAIHGALIATLRVHDRNAFDRCSAFLAEAPGVIQHRADVLSRKKRLEQVRAALSLFATGGDESLLTDADLDDDWDNQKKGGRNGAAYVLVERKAF